MEDNLKNKNNILNFKNKKGKIASVKGTLILMGIVFPVLALAIWGGHAVYDIHKQKVFAAENYATGENVNPDVAELTKDTKLPETIITPKLANSVTTTNQSDKSLSNDCGPGTSHGGYIKTFNLKSKVYTPNEINKLVHLYQEKGYVFNKTGGYSYTLLPNTFDKGLENAKALWVLQKKTPQEVKLLIEEQKQMSSLFLKKGDNKITIVQLTPGYIMMLFRNSNCYP